MVVPNCNNSSKNSKPSRCSCVKREEDRGNTTRFQEYKNISSKGLTTSCYQTAHDLYQSRNFNSREKSSFTPEIPNNCDRRIQDYIKNEGDRSTINYSKNNGLISDQHHCYSIKEDESLLTNGSKDEFCIEKTDISNITYVPEEREFGNRNEIMIVNYQYKRDGETEDIPAGGGKENIQNINKHNNHKRDTKPKPPQSQERPIERAENAENVSKGHKPENEPKFPYNLESSFISKEFETTSFVEDFLKSNPSYANAPNQAFGCGYDCLGTKMADIFRLPMENEFLSNIPMLNTSEVCYMEPRGCSRSCQGIPYRNQRCGIFQTQPKEFSVYPESNIRNLCCSSNLNVPEEFELMEMKERCCCRRKAAPNDLFEDDSSYQRHSGCCSHKKPNEARTKPTNKNRKRHFTCCKSGKVDKGELSADSNAFPKKKDQVTSVDGEELFGYPKTCCENQNTPSNVKFMRIPCQGQFPQRVPPNQKIHSGPQFKCTPQCPLRMPPEKDYPLIHTKPFPITKSVACGNAQPPSGFSDNKIDAGRNITIQIIPNCCQTKASPEHQNASVDTYSKMEEKIIYPRKNCCQDSPFGRQKDYPTTVCNQVTYQPCEPDVGPLTCCNDPQQYGGYDPKEKSFSRWWSCNWKSKRSRTPYQRNPYLMETRDCCTTTCQETEDGDCQLVTIPNCQRVLPIKNTYLNRDANLLKSLHRLNRGLLKDLFATPCASSSSACQNACPRKMRGSPFAMCATENISCPAAKPPTTNRCCQYEPECKEILKSCRSSKDILFECLRYLKKGMTDENHCEYLEEGCCCCCQGCRSCCCQRARCCETVEIPTKIEEKKPKSCRCRSVEAKQSLKNCGTIVSNHCFTKVETVCTNTEIRPVTPKPEIRRKHICCRRRCCCCCNKSRKCCCCCDPCCHSDPCCFSEPTTCSHNVRKTCCKSEHFIYCCQCHPTTTFESKPLFKKSKETSLEKCIDFLTTEIRNPVSKETENLSETENANAKSSELTSTIEKSTNTTFLPKLTPQTKDVLIKSITLDLCDLGEKKFSKFGVPSRQYPWGNDSFCLDMPHEIYRFVGIEQFENPILEKIYHDPTPCLKPEILHDDDQKEMNEQNAGGDIEKICDVKKRCLSTICEAFFKKKQPNNSNKNTFSVIKNEEDNFKENSISCENLIKENEEKKQIDEGKIICQNSCVEDQQKPMKEENLQKQTETPQNRETQQKNTSKSITKTSKVPVNISKKSSIISKLSSNSSKASSNISKTSINTGSSYTPKPFTTKTGLMSFIPSFRESYRSSPLVRKSKQKSAKIAETSKTKIEQKPANKVDDCDTNGNKPTASTAPQPTAEKIDNNDENKEKIYISSNESELKQDEMKKDVEQENEIKIDKQINIQESEIKPFDLRKFNEEMHIFYDKCFKQPNIATAEKIIPFYNTSVSDIIKSLECGSSINSLQINPQEGIVKSTPVNLPVEECNNITFPVKSNNEFYSEAFQRSYESDNMNIPNKIMSKSDLISLN